MIILEVGYMIHLYGRAMGRKRTITTRMELISQEEESYSRESAMGEGRVWEWGGER